jgi:hypothetical protein
MSFTVFCNGFWGGFVENTDGTGFGFFQHILERVFNAAISVTSNIDEADILLESHFGTSVFSTKPWKYSIFFSGEGHSSLPHNANGYTFVLGAQASRKNFVSCPLYLAYEYTKPFVYPNNITIVPEKQICSVISSGQLKERTRYNILDTLEAKGLHIDRAGGYKNNVGFTVPSTYYDQPVIDFYKQYKFVLAFENTALPFYITEKIINPLRAGVIPIYFGSPRICEYINSERILQITPDTIDECIARIMEICSNPDLYLQIVNKPLFVKSKEQFIDGIVQEMKIILELSPIGVEIIGNMEKEAGRLQTLRPVMDYYHKQPVFEVWGDDVRKHPLYGKYFIPPHRSGATSLAINHISILKKYAYKNKFLLLFESDVIPLHDNMEFIHWEILKDMLVMKEKNIDFVMLGKGCFASVHACPDAGVPFSPTLFHKNASRCTESYILSPEGIINFVEWFYKVPKHNVIDFDINDYFKQNPERIGCWRSPELFYQGSCSGVHSSSI